MPDPVMQHISKEMMLETAATIERLKPLADLYSRLNEILMHHSTVSCSGLAITIEFSDHDNKDAVMDLLCGDDASLAHMSRK